MKSKRVKYILIFFFSFLFLFFTQLLFYGPKLDFYWNFNNSLQISNGLIPYNDISLLTTPLFHFIVSFFLVVFGKNIVVYSVITTLFKLIHIIVLSKITLLLCNKYKIKNKFKYILIGFITFILLIYNIYYEYNFLSLLFVSLIIYIELLDKKNIKYELLIGFLAALSFLSKQSIGFIAILFVLFKPLLFKDNLKNILYRFIGISSIALLFTGYLLLTNSIESFFNYAVFGVLEFKNSVSFFDIALNWEMNDFINILISILLLLFYIIFIIKQFYFVLKKKYDLTFKMVLYYSLISVSCFYPIRNIYHLIPSLITFIPLIMITLSNYKIMNIKYYSNNLINRVLVVFIILCSLVPLGMYINIYNGNNKKSVVLKYKYNYINGMVVSKDLKSNIDDIIEFEEKEEKNGNKVLILNKSSVLFHLARGVYYKDYDLFMRGNFGYNGEERMIEDIENSVNTLYLVNLNDMTKDTKIFQLPDKVYYYVINNLKNTGQIMYYNVYSR